MTSLDTIGTAGFSHNFGSLDGKPTSVTEVFDVLSGANGGNTLNMSLVVLAQALPWLLRLPTPHSKLIQRLNDTMGEISNVLLTKSRKEKEAGTLGEREETSILGLLSMFASAYLRCLAIDLAHLVRAENQGGQLHLTREEVTAQVWIEMLC